MRKSAAVLVGLCMALAGTAAAGQATGFIDVTFNLDMGQPLNGESRLRMYNAQADTFLLNTAHLAFDGSLGRGEVQYVVQLDMGTNALVDTTGTVPPTGVAFDIQEAYFTSVDSQTGVGLRVGKFASDMGIERIESIENPTVTRGLLYNYGRPRTHTGAVVTLQTKEDLTLGVGAVNGWDVVVDNNQTLSLLAEVGYEERSYSFKLSYLSGPEQDVNDDDVRSLLDASLSLRLGSYAEVMAEFLSGSEVVGVNDVTWSGLGVYFTYTFDRGVKAGVRFESFDDAYVASAGARILPGPGAGTAPANGSSYKSLSLVGSFDIGNKRTARVEYRTDTADWNAFMDDAGAFTLDSQQTLSVQFLCKF